MQTDSFKAVTTSLVTIIPAGRRVELRDVGAGNYLIVRAETNKGKLAQTFPMTLFLRAGEFARHAEGSAR